MYIVDSENNRIQAVKTKTFSELGFLERENLQEWLAHEPTALGEELLIIQKEFDGFDDTRERLDLLALDKDGNLVIIENKLDDSGRDVVWQAIKYASYCASLTKDQIVNVFQKYIDRYQKRVSGNTPSDAETQICDFLEVAEFDEVKINIGYSQRIIMVAGNFRKEVTSAALWMLGQGMSVQCFRVTPHLYAEKTLISIDQIIPPPEVKELMIGIGAKEAEEKSTEVVLKNRHKVRQQYWEYALELFQKSGCDLYNNISPGKEHWLAAGLGISGCHYSLIFGKNELRVEVYFSRSDQQENKFIFDFLISKQNDIEAKFGDALEWRRLDDKKASIISYSHTFDAYNKEEWGKCAQWHLEHMIKIENAFHEPLKEAAIALKQQ